MKRILLGLLLVSSIVSSGQNRFSDYKDFIEKSVAQPDPANNPFLGKDYTIYSRNVEIGTQMKDLFPNHGFDRTSDNIYFSISPNYYQMFIPELHMLFTVTTTDQNINIGEHFIWLAGQIRKYKESRFSNSY